jgi:hypothetical protein
VRAGASRKTKSIHFRVLQNLIFCAVLAALRQSEFCARAFVITARHKISYASRHPADPFTFINLSTFYEFMSLHLAPLVVK